MLLVVLLTAKVTVSIHFVGRKDLVVFSQANSSNVGSFNRGLKPCASEVSRFPTPIWSFASCRPVHKSSVKCFGLWLVRTMSGQKHMESPERVPHLGSGTASLTGYQSDNGNNQLNFFQITICDVDCRFGSMWSSVSVLPLMERFLYYTLMELPE